MPHIVGNLLTRVITLLHTSSQLEVCIQSYGPPKLQVSQLWEFRDSHLGVSGQNDIWVLVPWPSTKYTIKGKVVTSPKFGPWWVLWVYFCPWLIHASKCSNYALTNLLFSLCRSMWVISLLVTHLSPNPRTPARPSTPKMLWTREYAPIPSPSCFHFWTHSWIHQGAWRCVQQSFLPKIINLFQTVITTTNK
jgi:hypothetical protein